MNGIIEAIYIFDEHNNPILSHTYAARPLPAQTLLPLYLEHKSPRPNLIYLSDTSPPTLVFSLVHANLTYLLTSTSEIEPLLALEFLHRVVDVLEEFLGPPLLAHKIESNYHVAAQLLTEMCDAGAVATTEPNALRDLVEVEGWMGKLLGSINLPGKQGLVGTFQSSTAASNPTLVSSQAPALPWRRANVRHTSNEMYADVVETLSVIVAPSGRPIAAFANGTIAFTSKVSGVPDILVTLSCPSGKHNLADIMSLPVFHPCVRLQRWKDRPGELSFIPPDGRFILAGYEVDLLPFPTDSNNSHSTLPLSPSLKLPVSVELKTTLGSTGSDFEVRVHVNKIFRWAGATMSGSSRGVSSSTPPTRTGPGGLAAVAATAGSSTGHAGTPSNPTLEDLAIKIPLPPEVRNLSDIRPSKGDATYNPGDGHLEWHIPTKELSQGTSYFGLKCTVVGYLDDDSDDGSDEGSEAGAGGDPMGFGFGTYHEPYQAGDGGGGGKDKGPRQRTSNTAGGEEEKGVDDEEAAREARKVAQNKFLMPTSASVSFAVKGWLPSGVKVESIAIDPRRSKGLGETIKPYKGVKYVTVCKDGVEIRC